LFNSVRGGGAVCAPLEPPDELEPGPVLVQLRHLHVDDAEREHRRAHGRPGELALVPGGLARPGDPERARGGDRASEGGRLAAQRREGGVEGDHHVDGPRAAPMQDHAARGRVGVPPVRRVQQAEAVALDHADLAPGRGVWVRHAR